MIYIIIAISLTAILYYYFFVYRKKILLREMVSAVDMVKVGVYGRLMLRYNNIYGKDKSGILAAAVTNELFSEPPSNYDAEIFLESNRELILKELMNLKSDKEICEIVTQAVRVKTTVAFAKNIHNKNTLINPLEKLKELDLLIPGGEAPTPNTFLPRALEFYNSTKQAED